MATKRITAGFRYIFYGVVNADGFVYGNDADGPAAGAAAGQALLRLEGAVTAPVAPGDAEVVDVIGDDSPMTQFIFEPNSLPSGVIEMQSRNDTFEALAQGTKVQSLKLWDIGVLQPSDPAFTDLCLLLQRRSKKWEAGVQGVGAWEILLIPRAVIVPLFKDFQTRQAGPYRYSVSASKSDRLPWGATFTAGVHGTLAAPLIVIESDNPVHLHCAQGNAIQTGFTVPYTPIADTRFAVFVDGVEQTTPADWTRVTTTVTFGAAPGAGSIINFLYEVDEADLS